MSSHRVRFVLFGYVFDNDGAKNLGLIRQRSVTKFPKKSALKLIFLISKKLSKVGVLFEKLNFLCFFSVFEPFENSNCYFKVKKVLNK